MKSNLKSLIKPYVIMMLVSALSIFPEISLSARSNQTDAGIPVIVSSSWLKENIEMPGLVILHVSQIKQDYINGHIPGALFLWPGKLTLSTENESVIPAPEVDVVKLLRSLGVNNNSHIILCGIYGNLAPVCRILVNLEHFGLKGKVSVLDGGFEAWTAAGYEVSKEIPRPKKGRFTPSAVQNLVNLTWMNANLNNKSYSIIDARAKVMYDGPSGTPRQGHIPGAKNIPPTELYDSKTFQFFTIEKLREAYSKLEIPSGSRPVFYCHTGNSASVAYVSALAAGYDPIIYDGSMEEWGSHQEMPLEK
jgi:thiosulfate/3-mercaptopyruvate sulfurtransferase